MRRKSFRRLRITATKPNLHHYVYVVLLHPCVGKLRKLRALNPDRRDDKPCVYVGMTGLQPEERFQNHKLGIKAARLVQRYGVRLLPDLYEVYNPMPFDVAAQMEQELAEDLRKLGYTVAGGY